MSHEIETVPLRCAHPGHDEIERQLRSGAHDILSLDVFDTWLMRDVPRPTDVCFLVAAALERRGALWPGTPLEAFVRERIAAETRARRAQPSHEVTLPEIHAAFPSGFLRHGSPADVSALEFEVECALVHPDPACARTIEVARELGLRVVFVSDTYFDRPQLERLTGGVADAVFPSCVHRRSKGAGLHAVVAGALGVPAGRILHAGDHPIADIEGPARVGVSTVHLPRWPDGWEQAMEQELPESFSARARLLAAGDHGLSRHRRAAAWACANDDERWGRVVLGPVLGEFSEWVRGRCTDEGISHALCLMREGRLLAELLQRSRPGPAAHECFLSRYAARRAAILSGSPEEIAAFASRSRPPERGRVLEQLGLAPDTLGPPGERLAGPALAAFAGRIAGNRSWRSRAVEASAAARRGLMAHLARLLPGDPGTAVAVVDLGYSGTIQACLERILVHERAPYRTHGLYLVTAAGVDAVQRTGAPAEGYLAVNGQPTAVAHTFLRSPEAIEQSLMAACGTTSGHDAAGEPVLERRGSNPIQDATIQRIQEGVRQWHRDACARRAAGDGGSPDQARPHLQAILVRAIARPSELERARFREWSHDENLGSTAARGLLEPADLHPWEIAHLSPHQLASLPAARMFWPCAWAHERSPAWGEAVAGIFLRQVDPAAMHAIAGERALVLYSDGGRGFDPGSARIERVALGPGGRAWHRIRLVLENASLRRFAFAFGLPGEVIGVGGVRLHLHPAAGPGRTIDVPLAAMQHEGYRALTPPWLEVLEDPAIVAFDVNGLEAWSGVVLLDLFLTGTTAP